MTTFLESVIRAFKGDANLLTFTEHDHEIIVQGRQFIPNAQWNELNAMVEQEFHGRYSSLIRGWAIPKPIDEHEAPTRTGIPNIDAKLNEIDKEKEEALRREARAIAHRPTPQDTQWAKDTLGLDIDPATGQPVEIDLQTADEILAEQQESLEDEEDDEEEPGLTATGDYVGEVSLDEGFQVIPLDQLTTAAVKLRQTIDSAYLQELADTIREVGVIQPILVRPVDDKCEIVAGEQRYRAAQMAGLTTIPCIVKALKDHEAFEAGVIENLQRRDFTAYEIAQLLQRALTEFHEQYPTHEVLAYKFGKTRPWVTRHLQILDLESKVPRGTLTQISERQARALLSAPKETRDEILHAIETGDEVPSARTIEAAAKEEDKVITTPPPPSTGTQDEDVLISTPPIARAVSKAKPYWCSWCGVAKAPHQVTDSWDKTSKVCRFCLRPVERPSLTTAPVPPASPASDEDAVAREPTTPTPAPLVTPPVDPYPDRLKVTVSQAERDVYQDLLTAYEEGRLKARPILNDDRVVFYTVRASYPDIIFVGVEAPVYLDNEAIHTGHEPWDDAVKDALKRQGAEPQRYPYVGSLTVTRRSEIVGAIITRINELLEEGGE